VNDSYRSYSVRSRSSSGLRPGLLWAAAGLAASWLFVQARSRQVEREHPPEGKFVTVDGVRLHYLERGEGPVLVLLHGNGVYSKDFELSGLLGMAASHYRVIAFDRPGFGYSERPRSTVWTPDRQARLLHHAVWMALRPSQLRAAAAESAMMIPAAMSLARRYGELKVPATILAGTQDKVASSGHNAERLHEGLHNSQLELQPGTGHMLHYAHPDKVLAAIDGIAAQVGEPAVLRNPRAEALARASESGV